MPRLQETLVMELREKHVVSREVRYGVQERKKIRRRVEYHLLDTVEVLRRGTTLYESWKQEPRCNVAHGRSAVGIVAYPMDFPKGSLQGVRNGGSALVVVILRQAPVTSSKDVEGYAGEAAHLPRARAALSALLHRSISWFDIFIKM